MKIIYFLSQMFAFIGMDISLVLRTKWLSETAARRCSSKSVRSNHLEVFLETGVLKICSKFTREHPCWSLISIKLLSTQVFFCRFATYFQNTFIIRLIHLRWQLIYNPAQNIWQKVNKSSKIGQGFKNLLSIFACFLTAIVKV